MLATQHFKRVLLEEKVASIRERAGDDDVYAERLGRALVARTRAVAHEHRAGFVLVDTASKDLEPSFPWRGDADLSEIADEHIDTAPLLREYEGVADLRMPRGHRHWTPFAHLMAGVELGRVILDRVEGR